MEISQRRGGNGPKALGKTTIELGNLSLEEIGDPKAPALGQVLLSRNLSLRRKWSQEQRAKERERQDQSTQLALPNPATLHP